MCLAGESSNHSKLFISDSNQIRVFDLKTHESYLYHEIKEDISAFDVTESSVYYTENNLHLIQSINPTNFNVKFTKRVHPQALAVDYLTKKFYMLDRSAGTVNVMDFEGNFFGIILSDLEDVHDIELDVEERLMFVMQYKKSVTLTSLMLE